MVRQFETRFLIMLTVSGKTWVKYESYSKNSLLPNGYFLYKLFLATFDLHCNEFLGFCLVAIQCWGAVRLHLDVIIISFLQALQHFIRLLLTICLLMSPSLLSNVTSWSSSSVVSFDADRIDLHCFLAFLSPFNVLIGCKSLTKFAIRCRWPGRNLQCLEVFARQNFLTSGYSLSMKFSISSRVLPGSLLVFMVAIVVSVSYPAAWRQLTT